MLNRDIQDVMRQQVEKLAFELQVRGLMKVKFAVKDNEVVYLILLLGERGSAAV